MIIVVGSKFCACCIFWSVIGIYLFWIPRESDNYHLNSEMINYIMLFYVFGKVFPQKLLLDLNLTSSGFK